MDKNTCMDAYLDRYYELFALPELTDQDCVPGVYCWYFENVDAKSDFLPLYIGQSMNLWKRCLAHEKGLKRRFAELQQLLDTQEAPASEGDYTINYCGHDSLYVRVTNTLMNRSVEPPYVLKFKVIQKTEDDALTYDTLMSMERYYIHYYGSDLLGFNDPLFLEWSKRVASKRLEGKATREDWQIFLQLLARPTVDRRLIMHTVSELLEEVKLDFLLYCPYLELCNGILLEYIIKKRKVLREMARQHMNANGEITYRNGVAGVVTESCEVFEKEGVAKIYKRLNRRRRKKNGVLPFEMSFDELERRTRL